MPVIPALRSLKQEDREFETILGYISKFFLKKPIITSSSENMKIDYLLQN
jgi:hypothetical protein